MYVTFADTCNMYASFCMKKAIPKRMLELLIIKAQNPIFCKLE